MKSVVVSYRINANALYLSVKVETPFFNTFLPFFKAENHVLLLQVLK